MIDLKVRATLASLLLTLPVSSSAELRGTDLPELVKVADVIVLAKVERIVVSGRETFASGGKQWKLSGLPLAVVYVERSYRGSKKGERFVIPAFSTWTCDATKLQANTTNLFFLQRKQFQTVQTEVGRISDLHANFEKSIVTTVGPLPILWVARSGQGQMPVRYIKGSPFILATKFLNRDSLFDHVSSRLVPLPKSMHFTQLPERKAERERRHRMASIGIRYVEGLVRLQELEREIGRLAKGREAVTRMNTR